MDDLILTISDDEVVSDLGETPAANQGQKRKRRDQKASSSNKKRKAVDEIDAGAVDEGLDSDFDFELADNLQEEEDFDGWGASDEPGEQQGDKQGVDIDDIIERRRFKQYGTQTNGKEKGPGEGAEEDVGEDVNEDDSSIASVEAGDQDEEDETLAADGFGMGAGDASEDEDEQASGEDKDEEEEDARSGSEQSEEDATTALNGHANGEGSEAEEDDDDDDEAEEARQKAFFAPEEPSATKASNSVDGSFSGMSLSRPILKGLSSVGFGIPTPIQAKAIPMALQGKDIVGGAETGSGKTGAFIIPILERLLFRPKKVPTTRVAILMPTRELAVQCYNVATKLAAFTDIKFGQAIGGMNLREQERQLKTRPDIVIATPGRFIDFMRNYTCLTPDTIEVLVLDEADRMLEEGFADELNEILNTIPKSRQTMLFSATMTSKVDDLVRVGLQRPVRLMVNAKKQTASGLVQEFVRLRPGREQKRLGYLMHLCERVYTNRVIVFFRQKKEAHHVRVVFAICGLKAAELHGNMTQEQRLNAIESFRSGQASFLLATDVASRGLDIKGIETVINYEAPQSHEIYLHRVGRTARAGRSGKACTLAAEPDRKVVKAAVKSAKALGSVIRQCTVDPKEVDAWCSRLEAMQDEIEEVLQEEKEEKALLQTERQINRADNIVKHEDEIKSRPKKTWFETEAQKAAAKDRGRVELNGPDVSKTGKEKRKKLSNKEKKKLQDRDDRRAGLMWQKGKHSAEKAEKAVKDQKQKQKQKQKEKGGKGKPKRK
ncbi:DEAD-domain-containing protein [Polychaeton citri CBS 116435]|uniref:RNA helicase n=1 Tax=Polychaeton citri CBS 116435 TaxID=1314669 RepID=A0A9P4QEZ3_9PEZI|nr:DEAD-domain-containing protein [Polychaeton citri CBS 116435]